METRRMRRTWAAAIVTVLDASRTVPPLAMSAYSLNFAHPLCAQHLRIAAVVVVLPWSI